MPRANRAGTSSPFKGSTVGSSNVVTAACLEILKQYYVSDRIVDGKEKNESIDSVEDIP